jgi:hypothetical protein
VIGKSENQIEGEKRFIFEEIEKSNGKNKHEEFKAARGCRSLGDGAVAVKQRNNGSSK